MQCDLVFIGVESAWIFSAIEFLRKNSKRKKVVVEKGKAIEKRLCPKFCENCNPYCNKAMGFVIADAFF